jgi:phosphoglycolate phosphatase
MNVILAGAGSSDQRAHATSWRSTPERRHTVAMLRAVLLDLDGTLLDSYEVWYQVVNAVALERARPPITREVFAGCWGQGIEADVERLFPGLTTAELEARYDAHFVLHLDHLVVDPDAAEVLATLREQGLRLAIVTNTPSPLAREMLARCGLELEVVVGGRDVPRPKPAGDMVEHACALLGVTASEAVMVGDTAHDGRAAAAAGVQFVGLRHDGDTRIESLADLPPLLEDHATRHP